MGKEEPFMNYITTGFCKLPDCDGSLVSRGVKGSKLRLGCGVNNLPRRILAAVAALGFSLTLASTTLCGATPIHAYQLNGSFADDFGGPMLVPGGPSGAGMLNAMNYTFGPSQGLSLSNALPNSATYSILIDFSLTDLSGYRKLVDFHALTSDDGVYDLNGNLNFYPVTTGPSGAFQSDVEVRLVITRDDSTDEFNGYVNGVLQITFTDSAGLGIFDAANNIINFFNDDAATGNGEASVGLVDQIAIYDMALTAAEVLDLGGPGGAVPEPSTWAMIGVGAVVLFGLRRRSRRRS
jgi:hypothetical protein